MGKRGLRVIAFELPCNMQYGLSHAGSKGDCMWHTLAMEFCLMLPICSDLCAVRGIVDSMHPILVSFAGKHYHLHNTHAFKNHDTSGACAQVACFG